MTENEIGSLVVKACIKIHQNLGPGLLESVYQKVLAYELQQMGLSVRCEVPIHIHYEGIEFEDGFRADIIVNDKVILELKSVDKVCPVHMKQLQTYLRLTGLRLGYLLNFGDVLMKNGIRRAVNGLHE
jgi:GxxExxY protein